MAVKAGVRPSILRFRTPRFGGFTEARNLGQAFDSSIPWTFAPARSCASGSTLSNYLFTAHGGMLSGSLAEPFGYKTKFGYYTDTETGLQLLTHRYYDPSSGRFLTRDPISYSGGINLYGYVGNQPLNRVDPDGTVSPVLVIVAIVVAGETAIHHFLNVRANTLFPVVTDPFGRQKHCYVNCMSTRIHLGDPLFPTLFSLGQESPALFTTNVDIMRDSVGDLAADIGGQQQAFKIWRSCKELCKECP